MLTDQEEKDLKHFIRWRAVQLLREAKSHRHGIFSCRDFHHAVEETAWKILDSVDYW